VILVVDGVIGTVTVNQESNMPTYTSNVPLATQQINQTQAPIQTNFQSIEELIDVNHVDFSDPVNFGKHNVSDYLAQANTPLGSVPSFITGIQATDINIYNTIPNGTTILNTTQNPGYPMTLVTNELIIEKGLSPSNSFIPFTATRQDINGNGWTYLPSGILLKWGQQSVPSGGSSGSNPAIVFPTTAAAGETVPVFKAVFQIILGQRWAGSQTTLGSNGFAVFGTPTTTQFAVSWSGNNSSGTILTYLAIGI
jgi:hypothetical protein